MRIIGEIPHPGLKITVFKMDNRITVKFENAHFDQSYKFNISEQLQHFQDVERFVDEQFIKDVVANFKYLNATKVQALNRFLVIDDEDEFDAII
mgnify:CR=1 FL=1